MNRTKNSGNSNAGRQAFMNIDPGRLSPGGPLGFCLYLETATAHRVMIMDEAGVFTASTKQQIAEAGGQIYILAQDRDKYFAHLETHLGDFIAREPPESPQVARMAYDISHHVMEKVFERPEAKVLARAEKALKNTTDLIMRSDQALFNLLKIARHDFYTYTHSCNVGLFGLGLVRQLVEEGESHNVHALGAGFFFHDLGKITVGVTLLNKPGPLDEEEWLKMKSHPFEGYKILEQTGFLTEEAKFIALQHHERHDGTGYPDQLKGDEIHLYGRICSIADVFDALTSERSYKKRIEPFEAARLMWENMNQHFDPEMLLRFVEMFRKMAQ